MQIFRPPRVLGSSIFAVVVVEIGRLTDVFHVATEIVLLQSL